MRLPDHHYYEIGLEKDSQALANVEAVAERFHGRKTRRADATEHIIKLWSDVVDGQISPESFWELFGVKQKPAPQPQIVFAQAAAPAQATPQEPAPAQEDQRARRRRANAAAAAEEWSK